MPPSKSLCIAAIAMLVTIATSIVGVAPASAAEGFFGGTVVRAHDAEAEMLDTINRVRAEYGLGALRSQSWGQFEGYLDCIAANNAAQQGLEHYPASCNQGFVEAEILAARYSSFSGGSTNTLVKQWNESTGHRRIMLAQDADYAYVGVFCIGHTSWAISWVGDDDGYVTPNGVQPKDIPLPFFTDNDYNCQDSAPQPKNLPLTAYRPAASMAALLARTDLDRNEADVLRLYKAFFSRDPEIGGANYWLGLSSTGTTLDAISAEFSVSDEFLLTYGNVDNRRYVEIVYLNVLNRAPDGDGFVYWLDLLNSGELDRGSVVRWIAANPEFVNAHLYGGV